MKIKIIIVASLAVLAGCQQTLKTEPPSGKLSFGSKVLVDDGSCPAGQIKQVTGGNGDGIPRKRECIVKPST